MSRRPALPLAAALAAPVFAGCISFPAYPVREDEALLRELTPLGGSVRVRTSFELLQNGRWIALPPARKKGFEESIAPAYRVSGLFDRVTEGNEKADLVAEVGVLGLGTGSQTWVSLAALTLFTIPVTARSEAEIETVLRRADTGAEIGRSTVCFAWWDAAHLTLLPWVFTRASGPVTRATL